MSTATPPKTQAPDVAAQITYAMRSMGVAPIPRNYELFYEAYIGSNPSLTRELAALGSRATQDELDALINDWTGTPINPQAPDRVPGGSSSGSASAVAAGLAQAAARCVCLPPRWMRSRPGVRIGCRQALA